MAWETSLTNRREGGRNRTRDRKGTSEPEDPAHKREPLTERGFGALAEPRPVLRGLRSNGIRAGAAPSKILAEPRPVLRGLRPRPALPAGGAGGPLPCRAETRSQGIATRPAWAHMARAHLEALQSRDPFSGDCDAASAAWRMARASSSCRAETRSQGIATSARALRGRRPGRSTCRAETRSQGIATRASARAAGSSMARLAEPRPVLRGLRPHGGLLGQDEETRPPACRAETRSQGIATSDFPEGRSPRDLIPCRAETRSQGIATLRRRRERPWAPIQLAEPRPVLRGLRPTTSTAPGPPGSRPLAEPRPVLRGLRPCSSARVPAPRT